MTSFHPCLSAKSFLWSRSKHRCGNKNSEQYCNSLSCKVFCWFPLCISVSCQRRRKRLAEKAWDCAKVRIFILNDWGEQRGSVQRINLKNQDDVHWIWTRILVKPGLNGLKAAVPLVLNKEKRYGRGRYQSWTGGAVARPIRYRYSTNGLPIHYRHTSVTITNDYRPICRPILDRYVGRHLL